MKLQVGERLEGSGPESQPGGYVVTSVVRETPWHGLYTGKKIFYNFDFTAKRVRETDDVEWLDVFLRTNRYPILDDSTYVQQRRALARAEVRAILGNRHSNLWPEPLDLLEIDNTRDPFSFAEGPAEGGEPIVVYARPTGRFTPEWQQQILPISSILSVLAEILEFMQQAHFEGLLLLGLGPASLLIDASDRVHFVGTEMVLAQQSPLLKDATPAALWQRLFPADRFVRGVSAPECFDPSKRPDVRSDVYAWGTLAYSLLTGTHLGQIAREQGKPFVTFTEGHWSQLEKVLTQLPRNSLAGWAEQIGVNPQRLLNDWPKSFLTVFRLLLSADPGRRPRSATELLAWLVEPPPPPIAGLIALHTDADSAKLLLDCTGAETGLEMTIQCNRGAPAQGPNEGATVADGPVRPVIGVSKLPVSGEPVYYTAFTRRRKNDAYVYSPGVVAQLWQPSAQNLRQWVEEQAVGTFDGQPAPTQVGMVLGALDARATTDSLLASTLPRVRAWGLRRVEQALRGPGRGDAVEPLLWRFLADRNAELRQSAAALLWSFDARKTDDVLLRLIEALEAPPVDAPIPLMHFLRQLQLPDERIRAILQQLESRRPTECPLCKKQLTHGERGTHLQTVHGYVYYQGDLLPVQAVITRLWDRAFQENDRHGHEELIGMYLGLPEVRNSPEAAVPRYLAGLQRFLMGETTSGDGAKNIPVALPYSSIVAYHTNLRLSRLFLPIARQLVCSPHRRLRDLGCQTVLPYIQEQLPARTTVADLRRLLTTVVPDIDHTDVQIDLCRQLAQLGVEQTLVNTCVTQLQEERLVPCTDCKAQVQARDLELHLRRAHQIFQFRGTRKTYADIREAMLRAICSPPPDLSAWKSLLALAEDKHPKEGDRYVVAWLYQYVKEVDAEQRNSVITALAEVIVAADALDRFLPLFAGPSKNASWEVLGQRIAVEICTRLSGPVPMQAVLLIMPFLDAKDLPRRTRENAVLALLRTVGKDSTVAVDVLRAFVGQSTKKRGIEKLQKLEQRFGHSPALDAVTKELDAEIRMSCPRCPTELRKKDMVGHLWDKHRLVLDGERVREPWRVIEDWVVDYGLEKDPQVLARCRELALKDDPRTGLARLQRLLYRRGLRDRDLLNELKAQVRTRKATLCPHCCATVAIEDPLAVENGLTMESARLQGYGYHLEVSERGLAPSLQIESPTTILFRGREPGRFLTRFGGSLLVVLPVMLIAAAVLFRFIDHELRLALSFVLAGGFGLVMAGFMFLLWPRPRPAQERLVKAAWKYLVPDILRGKKGRREWSFLNALVELSEEMQQHKLNQDVLLDCAEKASDAAKTDAFALVCLKALTRRLIADMRDNGEDPFDIVLTLASECFKGKLPVSFLGDLMESFHGKERANWSKSDLNRLPLLIAHQAFSADLDIDDWLSLGRAFPVVSAVLNLESRWHWQQFQAVWSQRNRKPWEAAGPAANMLDLAKQPASVEDLLSYYPDVLLYIAKANLVIGSKGVWIEGVCVTSFPPSADVTAEKLSNGYEVQVGTLRIRAAENPRPYLDDIKRWLRWYFHEFVPTVPNAPRPMTESRHRMWQLSKIACTECSRPLVACPGDLGVALK